RAWRPRPRETSSRGAPGEGEAGEVPVDASSVRDGCARGVGARALDGVGPAGQGGWRAAGRAEPAAGPQLPQFAGWVARAAGEAAERAGPEPVAAAGAAYHAAGAALAASVRG